MVTLSWYDDRNPLTSSDCPVRWTLPMDMATSSKFDAPTILRAAREASGLSEVKFATEVLNLSHVRTFTRWQSGEARADPTAIVVCAAIIDDPPLAARLAAIVSELRAQQTA